MQSPAIVTLTLFQLSWHADDYAPDGAAYGTRAEALEARGQIAIDITDGDAGSSTAECLRAHDRAIELGLARVEAIEAGADLTPAEAIMVAQDRYGFESDVYETMLEIPRADLLAALYPATGPADPNASPLEGHALAALEAHAAASRYVLDDTRHALEMLAADLAALASAKGLDAAAIFAEGVGIFEDGK
jgi:hypothetical protein